MSVWVSFQRLCDLIGHEGATTLCRSKRRYYVRKTPDEYMLTILSEESAMKLCAEFGGTEVDLPSGPLKVEQCKVKIVEMLELGTMSYTQIAHTLNCTVSHVTKTAKSTGMTCKRVKKSSIPEWLTLPISFV